MLFTYATNKLKIKNENYIENDSNQIKFVIFLFKRRYV
jgi:hypothetical protein